ncbi:MAG: hypothetical protein EZS28_019883 [Streblomastix strix]|uniref:Uncharacterized protein n=1 Tax=Streblomastix strix TaxID=222440 RepID=A0A5J4VQM7_9EUKA|nr:MAG: hypothetical protein EZS28_019883 [Streblomastix strix]
MNNPTDYAMKLTQDGLLIVNNIQLINNDFLQKIIILEQQVQNIQQQINGYSQYIGQQQADVSVINTELARQTHFRGYFTINDEILELTNPAIGDYAYSAEDLLVWDYDGSQWVETDKIVPDQMTPASDANPLSDGTLNAGTSAEYSRGDHIHPLNISTSVPISDTVDGTVGDSVNYARADHSHPINISSTTPLQDSTRSVGTANSYARSDHQHPINVETNASNIPIVDGVGVNGASTFYARHDHVHPQQLTYDGNVTATKFIKTGGLASEVLCANGDTTTIDNPISRTFSSGTGGYIRLCVFPAGASSGSPYIQFQVSCNTNAMQTIDLVPNYSVNGISALYGVFMAPSYVQDIYNVYYGVDQLIHTHTGTGSASVYTAWIHMMQGSGMVTVTVSKQSTYNSARVTEILTLDIVSSITGTQTRIPITFNFGNGGIIGKMLQVNPLDRNYNYYNNGIRIGNNNGDSTASLYLGCIKTATNTTQAGYWEISKTSDNALTINPSSLRQTDHSVGLSINSDSSMIKFNANELVDVGTDQSITGRKTINNTLQINPTSSDYTEGLRIARSSNGNCSGIYLGCNPQSTSGTMEGQWNIVNTPDGQLQIGVNTQIGQPNQGLLISADGQTLTFNGSVIAGTGVSTGAANGSVNYSAGNPILWGVNCTDPIGGFYSNGTNIYWRARPITLGSVPP